MGALIEDTRQQARRHEAKHAYFDSMGVAVTRCALPVGDYQRPAPVAVDTKRSIGELAMDLRQEHKRFKAECERAQAIGTQLVILVENNDGVGSLGDLAEWVESDESMAKRGIKARRISGKALARTCETFHARYGVVFGFCTPEQAGAKVIEILDYYGRG